MRPATVSEHTLFSGPHSHTQTLVVSHTASLLSLHSTAHRQTAARPRPALSSSHTLLSPSRLLARPPVCLSVCLSVCPPVCLGRPLLIIRSPASQPASSQPASQPVELRNTQRLSRGGPQIRTTTRRKSPTHCHSLTHTHSLSHISTFPLAHQPHTVAHGHTTTHNHTQSHTCQLPVAPKRTSPAQRQARFQPQPQPQVHLHLQVQVQVQTPKLQVQSPKPKLPSPKAQSQHVNKQSPAPKQKHKLTLAVHSSPLSLAHSLARSHSNLVPRSSLQTSSPPAKRERRQVKEKRWTFSGTQSTPTISPSPPVPPTMISSSNNNHNNHNNKHNKHHKHNTGPQASRTATTTTTTRCELSLSAACQWTQNRESCTYSLGRTRVMRTRC